MNAIRISIVTVVYNDYEFISDTIFSVVSQDYSNIEYIIIDGGSTDGTIDIIYKYDEDVQIILSEPDLGIYDAMNKGISLASGEVVGFINSGDLFSNEKVISRIASAFTSSTVDIVYGDLNYVNCANISTIVRHWNAGLFTQEKLSHGWMPPHPTFYVRGALYEQHGGYRLDYKISSDYDCMIRLLGNTALIVLYIPEVFVRMRVGGASNKNIINIVKKSYEDYKILKSNNFSAVYALVCKNIRKIPQFIFHKSVS
jgi:glycosyltransferase involved in cell wall biosynthesis